MCGMNNAGAFQWDLRLAQGLWAVKDNVYCAEVQSLLRTSISHLVITLHLYAIFKDNSGVDSAVCRTNLKSNHIIHTHTAIILI